jgi:lipopolysaccharide exporter
MVSDIPDRVVLTGVFSVAFPALAAEIREGRGLKQPYLRALGLITVAYWPALVLLALLAHPVVSFILGRQWWRSFLSSRSWPSPAWHGSRCC